MLTYQLKKSPGVPLYEALYRCIRADIHSGKLAPGRKLPSKRALAANLEVSKITVETAYNQLLAEGYIRAVEKVGYFVEKVENPGHTPATVAPPAPPKPEDLLDLTGGHGSGFPFSVWTRLQRQVILDYGEQLLQPLPNRGIRELRAAIAEHLSAFRGMQVDPECILIGAGTDFLYNLLIQLLGRDKIYAVEEPGYGKIRRIYAAGGVRCVSAPLDRHGVDPTALPECHVLHISPSHHFPTGRVTPLSRRAELLNWAWSRPDRYIIEDDYDSEFRFDAHPMSAMHSMDRCGRVIYMNTFSRSLAPSIRISYMVLPPALMEAFQSRLGFYSCTVASFEQYTLARFLEQGYFEKHINRMRSRYRQRRNQVISTLRGCSKAAAFTILEEDAGLHFLLQVETALDHKALAERFAAAGIRVRSLRSYYHTPPPEPQRPTLVINYSALREEDLPLLATRLESL